MPLLQLLSLIAAAPLSAGAAGLACLVMAFLRGCLAAARCDAAMEAQVAEE